jgi:pyruvate/2-oxoglutarate dehydrogenase complex dihydrolipoamide acyltransferase (E2) component
MDVTLPKWGMTMQEATISEWLVTVGDAVTEGQPIVRIESDKVEADVEAPGNGTVSEIVVAEGEDAEVGSVIARITP